MSATPEGGWSRTKWVLVCGFILAGQCLLIRALGPGQSPAPSRQPFGMTITLQPETIGNRGEDPALLALPGSSGFSGDAWLNYPPATHRLLEWSESPRWLSLGDYSHNLGLAFLDFAAANRSAPLRLADEPLPRNAPGEPPALPLPLLERSRLAIEGDLRLETIPELPSWQSGEVVSNSVIQVAVQPTGHPFSCVLLTTSGMKEADAYAMRLALTLRFRPAKLARNNPGNEPLAFGKLIFQWHTVPAPPLLRSAPTAP